MRAWEIGGAFVTISALLFLVLGAGRDLYRSWQVRSWVGVEGRLNRVWLERHTDRQALPGRTTGPRRTVVTYLPKADYEYEYGGKAYRGSDVTAWNVADSIDDSQRLVERLQQQRHRDSGKIMVWVNPGHPEIAVLNRDIRWKPVLAKGGVAVALLLAGLVVFGVGSIKHR